MTTDADEDDCPECGNSLFIHPVQAKHAGLIECDRCQTVVIWKSPMGTTDWSFHKVQRPDDMIEE